MRTTTAPSGGSFDGRWATEVCRACDPVFAAADVGFVRSGDVTDPGDQKVGAILWEADPTRFAARYPDSGIVRSYGEDQWPGVGCIDFWLYVEAEAATLRLSVEGWSLPHLAIEATGHGGMDGMQVASVFARILGVSPGRPGRASSR
ncbi:hypothetical protein [Nocardioides sp.]|uniref:hypothetical protein n=1 Tax=Nocardioides sp. TaxID=35761 RepID=UPI00286B6CB7|nr:hypothetical protein [Nocardioides sp.]